MIIALAMSLAQVLMNPLGIGLAGEARTFVQGIDFNLALVMGGCRLASMLHASGPIAVVVSVS